MMLVRPWQCRKCWIILDVNIRHLSLCGSMVALTVSLVFTSSDNIDSSHSGHTPLCPSTDSVTISIKDHKGHRMNFRFLLVLIACSHPVVIVGQPPVCLTSPHRIISLLTIWNERNLRGLMKRYMFISTNIWLWIIGTQPQSNVV
jgi:hypothetical protein